MLETVTTLQDVNGNTFDLKASDFMTINQEWREGFKTGYSRGVLVPVIAMAVVAGVSIGTAAFLTHRNRKKNLSPKE